MSPAAYLRTVASLVPQHLAIIQDDDFSTLSDAELLEATIRDARQLLKDYATCSPSKAV
jgi:hypothetical protein